MAQRPPLDTPTLNPTPGQEQYSPRQPQPPMPLLPDSAERVEPHSLAAQGTALIHPRFELKPAIRFAHS
jgi:hypothetical protein